MTIKDGYNGKPTNIRVQSNANGSIELWIEETGRPEGQKNETLSYITAQELLDLFKEIQRAGKDLFD